MITAKEAKEGTQQVLQKQYNDAVQDWLAVLSDKNIDDAIRTAYSDGKRECRIKLISAYKVITVSRADSREDRDFPDGETEVDKRLKEVWNECMENGYQVEWKFHYYDTKIYWGELWLRW